MASSSKRNKLLFLLLSCCRCVMLLLSRPSRQRCCPPVLQMLRVRAQALEHWEDSLLGSQQSGVRCSHSNCKQQEGFACAQEALSALWLPGGTVSCHLLALPTHPPASTQTGWGCQTSFLVLLSLFPKICISYFGLCMVQSCIFAGGWFTGIRKLHTTVLVSTGTLIQLKIISSFLAEILELLMCFVHW